MGTIIKAQRAFLATDSERFKHIEVAYVERGQARGKQSLAQIKQGRAFMLHKCARALIAAMLFATPALAIETQPRPPANVPSAMGTKASAATVAEKSNEHAATQATTKKAKHPNPAKAKSKVVKSKALNSKLGASNHRNSNRAMLAASKQEKSKKARPRPVENRTPADTTGSVPSRSALPALY